MQNIKNKSVFILVGMPGSGKSTLAKKLINKFNLNYLSSDEIRDELFKSNRYGQGNDQELVEELRIKAHKVLYNRATKLLTDGKKVIIDATHLDSNKRNLAVKTLAKIVDKNNICFITLDVSPSIIEERMLQKKDQMSNKTETMYDGWKRITSYFSDGFESGLLSWPTKKEGIDCFKHTQIKTMTWKNEIKLLCWDLDGTLYPNNLDLKKEIDKLLINTVAKKHNWTPAITKENLKKGIEKLKSTTKTLDSLGIDGKKFFTNTWDTLDLSLYIDKNQDLANKFTESKIVNAIFTNSNTLINVENKLTHIGINPNNFSFIMTSTQLGFGKPDIRVFEKIIKRSALKPHEILYIGDRDLVDIIPAKKAGLKTCMVYSKSTHADVCLDTPMDVLKMFD